MDAFDLFGAFLGTRGPGRDATPAEQLAAGITTLLFPMALFMVVLFGGLWKHGAALMVLTLGLSVAGFVICRLLSQRLSFAILTALGGALFNFISVGAAGLLAGLADFYKTF